MNMSWNLFEEPVHVTVMIVQRESTFPQPSCTYSQQTYSRYWSTHNISVCGGNWTQYGGPLWPVCQTLVNKVTFSSDLDATLNIHPIVLSLSSVCTVGIFSFQLVQPVYVNTILGNMCAQCGAFKVFERCLSGWDAVSCFEESIPFSLRAIMVKSLAKLSLDPIVLKNCWPVFKLPFLGKVLKWLIVTQPQVENCFIQSLRLFWLLSLLLTYFTFLFVC